MVFRGNVKYYNEARKKKTVMFVGVDHVFHEQNFVVQSQWPEQQAAAATEIMKKKREKELLSDRGKKGQMNNLPYWIWHFLLCKRIFLIVQFISYRPVCFYINTHEPTKCLCSGIWNTSTSKVYCANEIAIFHCFVLLFSEYVDTVAWSYYTREKKISVVLHKIGMYS